MRRPLERSEPEPGYTAMASDDQSATAPVVADPGRAAAVRAGAAGLGPWRAKFETSDGVEFGGVSAVDRGRPDWVRGFLPSFDTTVSSAMDLGCGEGHHAQDLAGFPGMDRVIGVDGREDAVRRARYAAAACGCPSLEFKAFDLNSWTGGAVAEDERVDLMFCADLLHHTLRPWDAIAWMAERTRHVLFLDTLYAEIPLYRAGRWGGDVQVEPDGPDGGLGPHGFRPTLGDLLVMLLERGFLPRFQRRIEADERFRPRVWLLCERIAEGASGTEVTRRALQPDGSRSAAPGEVQLAESDLFPLKQSLELLSALRLKQNEFEAMHKHARLQGNIIEALATELKQLKGEAGPA